MIYYSYQQHPGAVLLHTPPYFLATDTESLRYSSTDMQELARRVFIGQTWCSWTGFMKSGAEKSLLIKYRPTYYTTRYRASHYTFIVHHGSACAATVRSGGIFGAYTTSTSACIYSSLALYIASPTF